MRLYGGIDLGAAKIQAVVADDAGAVVGEARRRTPQGGDPVSVVAALAEALAAASEPALVRLILSPVALVLGLLPTRLFVSRQLDEGEVWIIESTVKVETR
jgi:predicted NBD/HSP70 family sugar kinase